MQSGSGGKPLLSSSRRKGRGTRVGSNRRRLPAQPVGPQFTPEERASDAKRLREAEARWLRELENLKSECLYAAANLNTTTLWPDMKANS